MTDLEMLKLCAEAVGETVVEYQTTAGPILIVPDVMTFEPLPYTYDPFRDDQQMAELVKKFRLLVDWPQAMLGSPHDYNARVTYHVADQLGAVVRQYVGIASTLNRAVVECVARMQKQETQ